MRLSTIPALLLVLGLTGCFADVRIARMRAELADDVRRGRDGDAAAVSSRITEVSSEAFGVASEKDIRVRTQLAETWADWKHFDRAQELAGATLSELERRHGVDDERIVPALLSMVKIRFRAHQWLETEHVLDRITEVCREHHATGDPYGPCRAYARFDVPRYYLAIGAFEKWAFHYLLGDRFNVIERDREGGLSMLTVLGRGYAQNGAYPEALWYLQRCVDELRPRYERPVASEQTVWSSPSGDVELVVLDGAHSFHSQSPRCLEDLIDLRRKVGEEAEADRLADWQRELWARGPDLEKKLVEKVRFVDKTWHDDLYTSHDANTLAFYYAGKGRHDDARRAYQEAIDLIDRGVAREGVFAGVYPAELHIDELLGLGAACEQTDRPEEAVAAYRRAAQIAADELHPRHAWRLEGWARSASVLTAAGDSSAAESEWRRYLAIAESIRGQDHADYALGLAGLARALSASGRNTEASTALTRAASIRAAYARRIESVRDLPLPVSLRSPPSPAN